MTAPGSLEAYKARLEGFRATWDSGRCQGWNWMSFKSPSHTNQSEILSCDLWCAATTAQRQWDRVCQGSLLLTSTTSSGLSSSPQLPCHCHQPPVPIRTTFFLLFLLARHHLLIFPQRTLLKSKAYKPHSTAAGNQV